MISTAIVPLFRKGLKPGAVHGAGWLQPLRNKGPMDVGVGNAARRVPQRVPTPTTEGYYVRPRRDGYSTHPPTGCNPYETRGQCPSKSNETQDALPNRLNPLRIKEATDSRGNIDTTIEERRCISPVVVSMTSRASVASLFRRGFSRFCGASCLAFDLTGQRPLDS